MPVLAGGLASFIVDFDRESKQGTEAPALPLILGQPLVDEPDRRQNRDFVVHVEFSQGDD
jgi:hypothetical protein